MTNVVWRARAVSIKQSSVAVDPRRRAAPPSQLRSPQLPTRVGINVHQRNAMLLDHAPRHTHHTTPCPGRVGWLAGCTVHQAITALVVHHDDEIVGRKVEVDSALDPPMPPCPPVARLRRLWLALCMSSMPIAPHSLAGWRGARQKILLVVQVGFRDWPGGQEETSTLWDINRCFGGHSLWAGSITLRFCMAR